MTELQTLKGGRAEMNHKIAQLIDVYERITKKDNGKKPRDLPFLEQYQ
jgi:hypothetical protein